MLLEDAMFLQMQNKRKLVKKNMDKKTINLQPFPLRQTRPLNRRLARGYH